MDLSYRIISAETDLIEDLEGFFTETFLSVNLASHALDHHKRVWKYARELILLPAVSDQINDELFANKLLIASYLHDSGMSVDHGTRHGVHSRRFCEQFLKKHKLPVNDFADALDAIENHDNKDYSTASSDSQLLNILSVADDLDAFGYIGIYRYLEIYLARNKPFDQIGYLILENVKKRFDNLSHSLEFIPGFIGKQKIRYEIIYSFFTSYNFQIEKSGYITGNQKPAGYCGVAELIDGNIRKNSSFENLLLTGSSSNYDNVIRVFFSELKKELISS
jgi:HD superfamily phosphodiesterase